jgi:hypothetical protein
MAPAIWRLKWLKQCAISWADDWGKRSQFAPPIMKSRVIMLGVQAIWLLGVASGSLAQTSNNPTPSAVSVGGRVIVPAVTPADPLTSANVRPTRPERRLLPAEVQLRIDRFKADARTYLQQQEALRRRYQGASADERAAIRAQLEVLRQEWLKRAKELRKDFDERRQELLDKLPGHKELLLEGSKADLHDQLRTQAKDQQSDVRNRRGTD